jgi:DNA-binding LacI/PurR family transcriptional regulator
VTLQTIADRVGVSRMTVSNAFSRPDQLSDELRERILGTARELGYAGPDPAARALAKGTTGAIGVLLTDSLQLAFTDEVATEFLGAVVEGLAPTGLALTLITSNGRDDVIPARDVAIDGALIYSCDPTSESREWLLRRRLPVVFVDQRPRSGISSINVDDRGGARAAAQHLLDLGHRAVAIICPAEHGTAASHPDTQRVLGWTEALRHAAVEPQIVHTSPDARDDPADAVRELLAQPRPPTAFLCFSDVLAFGVIRTAKELGRAVPRDLSVVGFDDTPAARISDPPLTTVRQDVTAKGHLAAAALKEAIDESRRGGTGRVRHRLLPTELVIRASTAPPTR